MSKRMWGATLIVVACAIVIFIAYMNNQKRQVPIIFSPQDELSSLWQQYKINFLEPTTYRVLDKQKNNITTSEGESYAMLRSVWVDDQDTFDKSWKWTQNNLQRKNDHLLSWLFGEVSTGKYGILTSQGGENTATDADTDTALALVFAAGRWNEQSYYTEAQAMIKDIWKNEVVIIHGKPYLAADNVEKTSSASTIVVNPSYLSPYAYRIFAKVDPSDPWMQLVDSSYDVLEKSMSMPLDKKTSATIPPDWILINKTTGAITDATSRNLDTQMSYDALRVPFRITLDWQWNKDPRAEQVLKQMSFLDTQWKTNSLLYTTYTHDGIASTTSESAAFYGGTIGYFIVNDPGAAKQIYNNKLQILFSPDTNTWKTPLSYYDDNWAWFGIALYNNQLPNLANGS